MRKLTATSLALILSILLTVACATPEETPTPFPTIPLMTEATRTGVSEPSPAPTAVEEPTREQTEAAPPTATPKLEPTRDPSLYNTPTPDAYALGHTPITTTENEKFIASIQEEEAACLHDSLEPRMHQYVMDLATSNSHTDERPRLWDCLSESTKNRILVAALTGDEGEISRETEACIAQMTEKTNSGTLWDAAHYTGDDPHTLDTAASLAYVTSSCLSGQPGVNHTQIGIFTTAMSTAIDCMTDQIGDPNSATRALQRGHGHTPHQSVQDAWEHCGKTP